MKSTLIYLLNSAIFLTSPAGEENQQRATPRERNAPVATHNCELWTKAWYATRRLFSGAHEGGVHGS